MVRVDVAYIKGQHDWPDPDWNHSDNMQVQEREYLPSSGHGPKQGPEAGVSKWQTQSLGECFQAGAEVAEHTCFKVHCLSRPVSPEA
jgi:hypothetical protein